jgi:XRE family transcriptional regulator, regulator of sulfur utilization
VITRRDVIVATVAAVVSIGGVLAAQQAEKKPILGPTVFDWNQLKDAPSNVGSVRSVVRQPTATLDELEMHITTLKPGLASHEPHRHVNEELIIIREGTVETLSDGVWKRTGPGSIIFNASNSLHGLRNIGTTPAVYHVINWSSPGASKQQ